MLVLKIPSEKKKTLITQTVPEDTEAVLQIMARKRPMYVSNVECAEKTPLSNYLL